MKLRAAQAGGDGRLFQNKSAKWATAGFFSVLLLIGVSMISVAETSASGVVVCAIGGAGLLRNRRAASVATSDTHLVLRSLVHTRRVNREHIAAVEVAVSRTGLGGYLREHLLVLLLDGDSVAFKEFNASPGARNSEVQAAAAAIRSWLTT